IDEASHAQMRDACSLPSAVGGAMMPDAHVGYGLPIGGVLATDNTVVPYAVGVDIACRMKLSVLDTPAWHLGEHNKFEQFRVALARRRGRAGVLAGDEPDGRLRRGESRNDSSPGRQVARREDRGGGGEPSQLCLEGNARRQGGGGASQRGDTCRPRRARRN